MAIHVFAADAGILKSIDVHRYNSFLEEFYQFGFPFDFLQLALAVSLLLLRGQNGCQRAESGFDVFSVVQVRFTPPLCP